MGPFSFSAGRFIFDDIKGGQRSEDTLSFREQLESFIMDELKTVPKNGLFRGSARKY